MVTSSRAAAPPAVFPSENSSDSEVREYPSPPVFELNSPQRPDSSPNIDPWRSSSVFGSPSFGPMTIEKDPDGLDPSPTILAQCVQFQGLGELSGDRKELALWIVSQPVQVLRDHPASSKKRSSSNALYPPVKKVRMTPASVPDSFRAHQGSKSRPSARAKGDGPRHFVQNSSRGKNPNYKGAF
ncbi:hypothetical protein WDU94_005420 [Cyamophila willieti]